MDAMGGWRTTCVIVAALGAVATIANLTHKLVSAPERVAKSKLCIANLKMQCRRLDHIDRKAANDALIETYSAFSDVLADAPLASPPSPPAPGVA